MSELSAQNQSMTLMDVYLKPTEHLTGFQIDLILDGYSTLYVREAVEMSVINVFLYILQYWLCSRPDFSIISYRINGLPDVTAMMMRKSVATAQ